MNIGVDIAIVDEGRILLTQREDSAAWCLPGGHVDPGEEFYNQTIAILGPDDARIEVPGQPVVR